MRRCIDCRLSADRASSETLAAPFRRLSRADVSAHWNSVRRHRCTGLRPAHMSANVSRDGEVDV